MRLSPPHSGRPAGAAITIVSGLRHVLAAVSVVAGALARADAGVLPAGFAETSHIEGLTQPMSFDFLPDGGIIIGEKEGGVKIWRDNVLHHAASLEVITPDESGINGVAADPDYAINNHVWIYRSMENRQRLARFTVVDNTLTDETVMLEFFAAVTYHKAGGIRFDSQKRLYVSTGDDGRHSQASQNLFDLHGKVLRLLRDGSAAPGNPYFDGVAGDPRVYAYGFRNPYRFSFEPGTENLFLGDVGAGEWEELNLVIPGGNYGWAEVEGFTPPGIPGVTYPVFAYTHFGGLGNSIIGGEHAEPGDLAPEYEGHYFYGDEAAEQLRHLVLGPSQEVLLDEVFETGAAHPVEIRFGPDGALYYLAFFDGTLQRVAFVGGANRAPIASGRAVPASGTAPLDVLLIGATSSDPDEDPLIYDWNTGHNGIHGATANVAHQYPMGVWHATLTVDDGQGGTDATTPIRIVSGNHAPIPVVTSPADEALFDAGDLITYAATATDVENGVLPCSAFSWSVVLRHLGHTHPHFGPIQGECGGSFVVPTTGETSHEIHYEIRLDVTDDGAPLGPEAMLTSTRTVQIRPRTAEFTLASAPHPGLVLTLDDQLTSAPETVTGVVNFTRTIGAPSPQSPGDGHTYQFASWSDGGAATHDIATPAVATTYTALFACDVIAEVTNLQVEHAPNGEIVLTWDPIADPCAVTGTGRYRVYASGSAFPAVPPGQFPDDPGFTLLATTDVPSLTFLPDPADQFFLVTAAGTDALDGPVGHYGD